LEPRFEALTKRWSGSMRPHARWSYPPRWARAGGGRTNRLGNPSGPVDVRDASVDFGSLAEMAEGRSTYVRLANLARELGVEYSTLHKWLQRHHPRPPGENHQRWLLSPSQVAAARTAFDSRRLSALLTEREARYERAWEIRENGGILDDIAAEFAITRERARQILLHRPRKVGRPRNADSSWEE